MTVHRVCGPVPLWVVPLCVMWLGLSWSTDSAAQLLWHAENVALLHGDDYEIAPPEQTTLTVEHASGWAWGDLFAFVDVTRFHHSGGEHAVYSEWNPRLSMSWLTDSPWTFGPISDVFVATTVEMGTGDIENLLIGPGLSLTVKGFDFLNVNAQYALPRYGETRGWQLTSAWSTSFALWCSRVVFEGYTDWVVANRAGGHANVHINPQLKLDVGPWVNAAPGHWYAGIEYDYWRHKFGLADSPALPTHQNTYSLMMQYKF